MATIINQKIIPYLWFDSNAEEAAEFYCSVFQNSKITTRSSMMVLFELEGLKFMALNGGPKFKFTEAISLFVNCETQAEVDELWDKLTSDGGSESMCGWLRDKFGLSWQIVPTILGQLLSGSEKEKVNKVMQAMLGMRKLDIEGLEKAYHS